MESNSQQLGIILGAIPRCGSNYLFNSLMLHPSIERVAINEEDKILVQTSLLKKYTQLTASSWFKEENLKDNIQQIRLEQNIGRGLSHFYQPKTINSSKLLLTKTPLTQGINNFFHFFPKDKIIILVRSGRDAIESGRKSFGWPYDEAIVRYKKSLQRIKNFIEKNETKKAQFLLVKYEDLLAKEEAQIRMILNFLNLDEESYPFDALKEQAVKGSSTTKMSQDSKMNWKGFTDKSSFDPTKRSAHWPKSIIRMYYRQCNELLVYFGYPQEKFKDNYLLRLSDKIVVLFKNLKGIVQRAKNYSIKKILSTIVLRLKKASRILIFGYYRDK